MARSLFEQLFDLLEKCEQLTFFEMVLSGPIKVRPVLKEFTDEVKTYIYGPDADEQEFLRYLGPPKRKDSYARNLLSDLTDQLQGFVTSHCTQDLGAQFPVLNFVTERNGDIELYLKLWKKVFRKNNIRLASLDRLQIEFELLRHFYQTKTCLQDRRPEKSSTDAIPAPSLDTLGAMGEAYFSMQKMFWELDRLQKGIIRPEDKPRSSILTLRQQIPQSYHDLFDLLHGSIELFQNGNPETYREIKRLLRATKLESNDALYFCHSLQNYCIRKINDHGIENQKQLYLQEYLDWIRWRGEEGLLYQKAYFPHSEFKNIITCFLKLEPPKTSAALDFWEQFGDRITPNFKAETLAFCEANICFHAGQLEEAYHILWAQKFSDPFHKTDARTLELKILYALNRRGNLDSLVENVLRFLQRHQGIPAERKTALRAKVNFLKRILNVPPMDRKRIGRLRNDILKAPELADRQWLLDQLDQLAGSSKHATI